MTRVILEQGAGAPRLLFADPRRIVVAWEPGEVDAALAEIEAAVAAGRHAAGFLAYELAYALEPRLAPLMPARRTVPLLWFAIVEEPAEIPDDDGAADVDPAAGEPADDPRPRREDVIPEWDAAAYQHRFDRVKRYITAGDVYQVNLTFRARFACRSPRRLYEVLRRAQPTPFGAYIETPDFTILSCSPELFFECAGGRIVTRPMKGTAARERDPDSDRAAARRLVEDEKTRAENLMIVDLMRNDLGRLARLGSVRVDRLFETETHPTLHQLTSTVSADLATDGVTALVRALFPPGSVTGAPKIRAQEIIAALETSPRGVYTGAIGHFAPGGRARFNVAIRTVVVDRDGRAEIGVGGGVVHDSVAAAEHAEALLKMRFLTVSADDGLGLIETLRWERASGFVRLDRHLARLGASAVQLGFVLDPATVRARLHAAVAAATEERLRVRLVLRRCGTVTVEAGPIVDLDRMHVRLAGTPVDPHDWRLRHKITERARYDGARRAAEAEGFDEVLFVNTRGELTEGSFTTLFVALPGEDVLLTPALACGLLPGCLRAELLESGRAREAVLTTEDLARATAIHVGNSLRGLLPAVLAQRVPSVTRR
ncbi:Aminodeoxychorismate synthase component 1 [Rhodoplanes serenus]|uniref:Probable branched-chain-amino-acid aminotransferase n=1 Tax=Rhodoplanes serenus TaxID=200615 RepID=A0A3S5CYP6_9BRAD|nr:aminodeoxychorismate synthase component I [Rhodoplanes serenus]VCU11112.1 Aminodeoxychorismate synthase component 1 [Rhodoplanes serenus]